MRKKEQQKKKEKKTMMMKREEIGEEEGEETNIIDHIVDALSLGLRFSVKKHSHHHVFSFL